MREEMIAALAEGNEDPGAFLTTSRYLVVRATSSLGLGGLASRLDLSAPRLVGQPALAGAAAGPGGAPAGRSGARAAAARAVRRSMTVRRLRSRERSAWLVRRSGRSSSAHRPRSRSATSGGSPSRSAARIVSSARVSAWSRRWPPGPDARE